MTDTLHLPTTTLKPTDSDHAKQPRLCNVCTDVAFSLAAVGLPNDRIIKRCQHTGTLAICIKRDGVIVRWSLEGPLTDAEADEIGMKILKVYADAGMRNHTPTQQ